jgi:hypothetical protein
VSQKALAQMLGLDPGHPSAMGKGGMRTDPVNISVRFSSGPPADRGAGPYAEHGYGLIDLNALQEAVEKGDADMVRHYACQIREAIVGAIQA